MIRAAIVLVVISIILVASSLLSINPEDDYCSVCEWNYVYGELRDYHDVGYGHASVLMEIWNEANYGTKVDLKWFENYRLKYNITNVYSFNSVNYSNPRPQAPDIKFMAEGNISRIDFSHDVGYGDLIYVNPIINGTKYDWTILAIGDDLPANWTDGDAFPYNYSHTYYVYKQKHEAWHNSYKSAVIVDGTLNPEHKNNTLAKWDEYYIKYNQYLENGGINLGDDYWM